MRTGVALVIAAAALGGARIMREQAHLPAGTVDEPYVPSASAAPIVTLGFHQLAADLWFVRLRGYFGGDQSTGDAIAGLTEAIVAVDPGFHRIYELGANAMTIARYRVTRDTYLRAIAVLERGATEFPDDWKLPWLAGQIYTQDLKTDDPAERRAWDERGTLLVESAIRKPGAPADAAAWAAIMRTRLGQHERAISGLREMVLLTNDDKVRNQLIDQLAELEHADAQAIDREVTEARVKFNTAWLHDRPAVPPTMYVLLGPHLTPTFDPTDLATGGRDLVGSEDVPPLEPLE
jgi:hypothetical protein